MECSSSFLHMRARRVCGGSINGSSDGHKARAAPAPRRTRANGSRGQRAHPRRRPSPCRGKDGPILPLGFQPSKEDEKEHTRGRLKCVAGKTTVSEESAERPRGFEPRLDDTQSLIL